jgi:hypothetical protein
MVPRYLKPGGGLPGFPFAQGVHVHQLAQHQRVRRILMMIAAASLAGVDRSALAADRYYVGAPNSLWSSASSWSATSGGAGGASVPVSGDDAIYDTSTNGTYFFDGNYPAAGLNDLRVEVPDTQSAFFLRQDNNTLSVAGAMTVGRLSGTTGKYILAGGVLKLTGDEFNGDLRIAQFAGSSGQVSMAAGTTFTSVGVVNVAMSGGGTFSQQGGNATIGSASVGRTLNIGLNSGGTGAYYLGQIVGGSAANLDVYGNVNVGVNGSGQLWMNATTMNVHGGYLAIANGASSSGLFVMNGGTLNVGVQTTVGGDAGTAGGNGSLIINNGTVNSALRVWANGQVTINGGTLDVGSTPNDNIFNQGTITLNDGVVNMGGDITGPGFFIQNGGTVNIANGTGIDTQDIAVNAGSVVANGNVAIGKGAGSTGILNVNGGGVTVNGTLGVGNTGSTTSGSGTGTLNVSGGTLYADTILEGSTTGGSGNVTINGTGEVTVGGGLSMNSVTVAGNGKLTVLDQNPPVGEDPVLNRSIVGGYLRDGAMNVNGGTVITPKMKLGVTSGKTGTYTQTAGNVTVGILGVGNDGTMTTGAGSGVFSISGGTLYADTILEGSTTGGSGNVTINGTGEVTVGGGLSVNSVTVAGNGKLTVLDQNPPVGEDPVLNRSIVGGYLRDGAMNVNGGTVISPKIKLGITSGKTGTYTQTAGAVTVGILGVGNDGTMTTGAGSGVLNISGGTLYADTILEGSTTGGSGNITINGTGEVTVGGGFSSNSVTVAGSGKLTVLDQNPPAGEDPVLNRSIVGGYLRDGAMNVNGGTVITPKMKLGVTAGKTGTLTQTGGTLTVNTLGVGNDATTTGGAGIGEATLTGGTLNATNLLIGSTAGGSGTVTLTPGAGITAKTTALAIIADLNNKLNLNDNKLVIGTGGTGTLSGVTYSGVSGSVQSGRNGGTWDGGGIITSMPDALINRTTVAVASAGEALGLVGSATKLWGGQTVTSTDTLVMYTYAGDLNVDGVINADDYAWIDLYSQTPGSSGYLHGDINYNGVINADDYAVIDLNVMEQGDPFAVRPAAPGTASLVAVPEPAIGGVVMLLLPLMRRRRR